MMKGKRASHCGVPIPTTSDMDMPSYNKPIFHQWEILVRLRVTPAQFVVAAPDRSMRHSLVFYNGMPFIKIFL